MDFRVLGRVEVESAGQLVPLGSGRERFVLVLLLLEPGRQVGSDRLIDALWRTPPPTARAQLHNLISKLRTRLTSAGADVITTTTAGYRLDLGAHTLDLVQFRQQVDRARCATDREGAADLLVSALGLWRAPVLEGVDEELVAGPRARLQQEYLAVVQRAADLTSALHRHDDALQWLDLLLAENPYHEQLYESRMLALVGAGRRADALATYRTAYRRLVDDLGVEPGAPLRRLEQLILAGTVPVGANVIGARSNPVPHELPRATGRLTGRDKIVGGVCDELRAAGSVGPVALLVGAAGIGKTAIAVAAGRSLAADFPDGVLHADLRGSHPVPEDPHVVVGRFLRSLGVACTGVPDDPDERLSLYRSMQTGRHLLVVLDDAADERQVRPLLPAGPRCAGLVTSRRRLGGLLDARRWSVPLMTRTDAEALLAGVIGAERVAAEPAAAAAVVDLCGLLPLAVCVAAARLGTRPDRSLADYRRHLASERARLDELAMGDLDVRASIGLSYNALDEPGRRLLRRLGEAGLTDAPEWAVEALGEGIHHRALEQLIDLHLVEPRGRDAVGQIRFGLHALVAEYAQERAADGISADGPGDRLDRAAAVGRLLQGWLGMVARADELVRRVPAQRARLVGSPFDARAWFDAERANLVQAVELGRRWGLASKAGSLALRIAGFPAAPGHPDTRLPAQRTSLSCPVAPAYGGAPAQVWPAC